MSRTDKRKPLPSAEYIREHLYYCPDTGALTWRKCPPHRRVAIGQDAAPVCSGAGRTRITFRNGGVRYAAPRVIWCYMTGEDPGELDIDHRDRDKLNNRWSNLRKVDVSLNQQNKSADRDSLSGLRGVWQLKHGVWAAQIVRRGVRRTLGWTFPSAAEASAAYEKAAAEHEAGLWPMQSGAA